MCVCRDCGEFIVVCECEHVHVSLSLLFFRAVYCLIQWVRNEARRKLGKMSKGLFHCSFPIGAFLSRDRLRVMACNWKWDREEWGSVCTFRVFAIVSSTSYTFIEAATEQQKLNRGRKEVTCIHNYGNMLCIA